MAESTEQAGLKSRRTKILLIAAIAFVFLVMAVYFLLPRYIQSSAIPSVSDSSGLSISCRKVSARGFWLKFHDLSLCSAGCSEDDPFVLKAGLVRVLPDFFSMLKGKVKPSRVEVSGLDIRIDLSTPEKSRGLAEAVAKIEKLLGRGRESDSKAMDSGDAKKAEKKGGGGTGDHEKQVETIPIHTAFVNLDITFPYGIRMTSNGASNSAVTPGKSSEISLGQSVLKGRNFKVEVDDISLQIGASGSGGIPTIRTMTLLRPSIGVVIPDRCFLDMGREPHAVASEDVGEPVEGEAPDPLPDEAAAQARAAQEAQEPGRSPVFAGIQSMIKQAAALIAPAVSSAEIQMIGADIFLYGGDLKEPLWTFRKVAGSVSFDAAQKRIDIDTYGDLDLLPFKLKARCSESEIDIEADLPVIALKNIWKEPEATIGEGQVSKGILAMKFKKSTLNVDLTEARADINGRVLVDLDESRIDFSGRAGLKDFMVDYDRLSAESLEGLFFSFLGDLEWTFSPFGVSVGEAELSVCGLPVLLHKFAIEKKDGANTLKAGGSLPPTDCHKLFSAMPFGMRSNLSGFRFGGVLGASFDVDIDFDRPAAAVIDFDVKNQCDVLDEGQMDLSRFSSKFVHEVNDKLGQHQLVMGPGSGNWADFEEISPYMVSAAVTTEDGAFFHHNGVSAFAIKRAVKKDLQMRGFYHGASTITMQLSKNLFLSREKTIARKLQEIIISWWLERSMNKDRIMELYLNVIEYGPEIYGVSEAANHYFGKEPIDLTVLESVWLAKMLPNPVSRYRYYEEAMETGRLAEQ
ncbi:MAG: biosynthetic peptidoglycan transglycosylase, partial [Pseudomonadota bacterium]